MPASAAPLAALSTALVAAALVTAPAASAPPPQRAAAVASAAGPAAAGPALEPAAAGPAAAGWAWPLAPAPAVLRGYDEVQRYAAGHRGVDLAAGPGQAVLAPAAGVVAFAGPVAGRGVVVLEHAGGLRSTYEPALATLPVGARARRGEAFAVLTAGQHCGQRPCLHLGLRRGADHLDPLAALAPAGPPVLLPLGRAG
ncbi:murein hydrolase activator EnvC family protein [Kineococcus sp. SYSU DK005]|uniref:murein hydrolase activator EnvC family protein n=1 Tax=Kineococcus sp. SYSU DK005 TaxID=3383126 RepID=UPI003D7CBD4A